MSYIVPFQKLKVLLTIRIKRSKMARPVTASDKKLTIQIVRIKIEMIGSQIDTPKIRIIIQNEDHGFWERRNSVPVQETELPGTWII